MHYRVIAVLNPEDLRHEFETAVNRTMEQNTRSASIVFDYWTLAGDEWHFKGNPPLPPGPYSEGLRGKIARIEDVEADFKEKPNCYGLVTPNGWLGGEHYYPWRPDGKRFVKAPKPPFKWLASEYKGSVAVVVDAHG